MYETNKDFREYVDRYSKARDISVKEALSHELVKNVANYYKGIADETK